MWVTCRLDLLGNGLIWFVRVLLFWRVILTRKDCFRIQVNCVQNRQCHSSKTIGFSLLPPFLKGEIFLEAGKEKKKKGPPGGAGHPSSNVLNKSFLSCEIFGFSIFFKKGSSNRTIFNIFIITSLFLNLKNK